MKNIHIGPINKNRDQKYCVSVTLIAANILLRDKFIVKCPFYTDAYLGLQLDRSTVRYIYRENKILIVDLSIHAQKEKCLLIILQILYFIKIYF
jgi:hypothetical protein